MDFAYFVRAAKFSLGKGKRVSDYHHGIFHGMGTFHGREDDTDWISPSATNEVRDVFHIWRSGTVVPSVFSPSFGLLVLSTAARKAVQGLTGLAFIRLCLSMSLILRCHRWDDCPFRRMKTNRQGNCSTIYV